MAVEALAGAFAERCAAAVAGAGIPAAAVGVLHEGRIWAWAQGAEPDATFRIASLTKPFTATLALALERAGAVELDELVPLAPAPDVTLRQLLSHTGGFESECGDLARFGEGDDALPALVRELRHQRRLVPPGTLWSYCNAGYWLAGHLLGERGGSGYEDALAAWVLEPLGLERTGFGEPDVPAHDPEPARPHYPRARRASGGLVSNVPDLLAFARFQLETPEAAVLRRPLAPNPGGHYGLGFQREQVGGLDVWGHGGSWGGYESLLALVPDRGFAFVALASGQAAGPVLRDLRGAAVESALGVRQAPPPSVPLPARELELLAGRYAGAEAELTVAPEADGLAVEVVGEAPAHARPLGDRLFEVVDGPARGSRFDFHPVAGEPRWIRWSSRLAERQDA